MNEITWPFVGSLVVVCVFLAYIAWLNKDDK